MNCTHSGLWKIEGRNERLPYRNEDEDVSVQEFVRFNTAFYLFFFFQFTAS